MRRKRKIERVIESDPVYNNTAVSKFINYLMWDGKKSTARRVLYDAFEHIQKETKKDPLVVFTQAIDNVSPLLEVKSRRVGGANYQVPREVRGERKIALAFRWLREASRAKKGKPMSARLAEEIILASKKEGTAIKKREDTHRMAEANRAFAHFSW